MTDSTPTCSPLDLAALAEIANAATPGSWEVSAFDSGHSQYESCCSVITADSGDSICDMDGLARTRNEKWAKDDGYADARHIAAFDPPTVLALIRDLEGAQEACKTVADLAKASHEWNVKERAKLIARAEAAEAKVAAVQAFATTFEAVPHRDENATQSSEEAYDEGYAIGHNDALTELGKILDGGA